MKLLDENGIRFNQKCNANNSPYNYRDIFYWSNVHQRLKRDLGKFDNKVTDLGKISCLNTPGMYGNLIEHE
ncbi:Protein of unknown function [Cotesia congregata]|uniref:Uncharacterized protein n=1 Tax=Cotesia congregata TaxID=51543 RepID=A0A8J2EEV0_COTCN|nr:Protein of unknown function [Cotesia congregata]